MSFMIERTRTPRRNHTSPIYTVQLLYFLTVEAMVKKWKDAASASASPEMIEVLEDEGVTLEETVEVQ